MANWYGAARSNYFRVKDEEAFKKDMAELAGVDVRYRDEPALALPAGEATDHDAQPPRRFAIFDAYGEGWPTPTRNLFDGEGDRVGEEELDLFGLVASHLADGEVAVFQEAGAEKQRYVTGFALAINADGETITVDIDDIYDKLERAGWPKPTRASR